MMTTKGPICEEIRAKLTGRLPSTRQDLTEKLAAIKLKQSTLHDASSTQNQLNLGHSQSLLDPDAANTSQLGLYQHPVSSISQQNLSVPAGFYTNVQGSLSQGNLHSPQPSYTYPPPQVTQSVHGSHPAYDFSPLPTYGPEHGPHGVQGASSSHAAGMYTATPQISSNVNYGFINSQDSNPVPRRAKHDRLWPCFSSHTIRFSAYTIRFAASSVRIAAHAICLSSYNKYCERTAY